METIDLIVDRLRQKLSAESVEIEDSEHESDYSHINEKTPFEESEKSSDNEKSG